MTDRPQHTRLAVGAVTAGIVGGLLTFALLPAFQQYVAGVMRILAGSIPLEPHDPGFLLSLVVAFFIGVSMNVLPCNIPIVMTLLPATSSADSRRASLRRTGLYALGAITVLGALGFGLGWAGAKIKPLVLNYPLFGVAIAGTILGTVGVLSIVWGLRELGVISIPTISIPALAELQGWVDKQSGHSEYVLLGAVYGGTGGGCPMPTYHLLLVWVVVAANALFGAVLLGMYVLGRVVPVAVLGVIFWQQPTRAAHLFSGQYGTLRQLNGVILAAFGSLLLVFAGLRVFVGGA